MSSPTTTQIGILATLRGTFTLGEFHPFPLSKQNRLSSPWNSEGQPTVQRVEKVLENFSLFSRSFLESDVDQPTALVVQDIGSDLSNLFRGSVTVEVIVLYLEVLSHGDEDVEGFLESGRRSDARHVESESDGEVEGVVGSFIDDNEMVSTCKRQVSRARAYENWWELTFRGRIC